MPSFQETRRRAILPLAGLGLALYYLAVFVPLSRHAAELDAPLRQAWKSLAASLDQTNAVQLDFQQITNQLAETRQTLAILERTHKRAAARLELSPVLRARMKAPFQLVEYENERGKELDELSKLARQQQVAVESPVFSGFPEHTVEVQQPALLWAALSLVDGLLAGAIQSKVSAIHSLESPVLTNAPVAGSAVRLIELPVQIEVTGPVSAVTTWLRSLPLRGEELRAAGLPELPTPKLPLFIDRLVIKKQAPEKPDEVRVWLRAIGFVLQE